MREQSIPAIQELEEELSDEWDGFMSHFNSVAQTYKVSKANANRIFGIASGSIPHPREPKTRLAFRPGEADNARKSLEKVVALFAKIAELRKFWARKERNNRTSNRTHSMIKMGATGTTDERDAAAIEVAKPSSHVTQAIADQQPYDRQSLQWSPLTDPCTWKASLTQQLQHEQEVEDMAAAFDDEEPLELDPKVAKYTQLLHSVASKGQPPREDITLPEPTPRSDTDSDIQADCSGPAIEESSEIDVLQIPICDMRKAMLEYIVAPVLNERLSERYKASSLFISLFRTHRLSRLLKKKSPMAAIQVFTAPNACVTPIVILSHRQYFQTSRPSSDICMPTFLHLKL